MTLLNGRSSQDQPHAFSPLSFGSYLFIPACPHQNVQLNTIHPPPSRHSLDSMRREPSLWNREHLKSDTRSESIEMWTYGRPPNSPEGSVSSPGKWSHQIYPMCGNMKKYHESVIRSEKGTGKASLQWVFDSI